jgi:transcriptional regulator with XRE-family HTH domain
MELFKYERDDDGIRARLIEARSAAGYNGDERSRSGRQHAWRAILEATHGEPPFSNSYHSMFENGTRPLTLDALNFYAQFYGENLGRLITGQEYEENTVESSPTEDDETYKWVSFKDLPKMAYLTIVEPDQNNPGRTPKGGPILRTKAIDDSMNLIASTGDTLVIDTSDRVLTTGLYYIFLCGGSPYFRRYVELDGNAVLLKESREKPEAFPLGAARPPVLGRVLYADPKRITL